MGGNILNLPSLNRPQHRRVFMNLKSWSVISLSKQSKLDTVYINTIIIGVSVLGVHILLIVLVRTVSTLTLIFLFDIFTLLKPFHWKGINILCNKLTFTQTLSSFTPSTFSFLHSILHYSQINSFDVFDVIWLYLITHKSCYLFVIGGHIEKLLQSFEKVFVIFFLPRDLSFWCSIFFEFNIFRPLKHFVITLFNFIDLFSTAEPSFFR